MCPMSNYKKKIADKKMYPYVSDQWVQVAEKLIRGGVLPRVETTVTELWERRKSIVGETGSQLPPPKEILLTKPLPNLLVDWWISGLPWEEFVAKMSHPSLFDED